MHNRRRNTGWSLLLGAVVALAASATAGTEPCDGHATTIVIVRHAEKVGESDSLSAAGMARAQELARVLQKANVRGIYHSDTHRTRDTAMPLAAALQIKPVEYPAKDAGGLIKLVLRDHAGETVLVVGHSNTIPMIISAAGGPAIQNIADGDYDEMYILTVPRCPGPAATLTSLQYGVSTPQP
jgi:broad specificity phosphatase PhoE